MLPSVYIMSYLADIPSHLYRDKKSKKGTEISQCPKNIDNYIIML